MELTFKEMDVIRAYTRDEFVADRGWEDTEAGAWVEGFHTDCGMGPRAFAGVLSSLVKKGLVLTNGESFTLTTEGIEVTRAMLNDEANAAALAYSELSHP